MGAALCLAGGDAALIAEARSLHFHNPEYALKTLAKATNLARQAQIKAVEALP
jgi:formate-dependent nitrite reductase cytochrome c552 subunit